MSPRTHALPQSLPSFAHTFPDIAARTSHASSSSPQPRAGSKRRYDTLDAQSPDPLDPAAAATSSTVDISRRQKRLKSPAPPQSPHRSRSSSVSQDVDDILVKEEEPDTEPDPSPSRSGFPPPPRPSSLTHSATTASMPHLYPLRSDSITYTYPDPDTLARKRRRVTISGAHLQAPPSRSSPTTNVSSPLTPSSIVSPVVMGFSVPRTPQGIPHKTSVDQVRSALSLKQQQKALIEARRANPSATIPLPTPPATGGSSSSSATHPTSAIGPSSATPDGGHADGLSHFKSVRTRGRAVTVTTGMALTSADYIPRDRPIDPPARATLVEAASRHVSPPPSAPAPHTSDLAVNSSAAGGSGTLSLLARRRGPSALGVNTSGISNAGSTVNTASAISSQLSQDDQHATSAVDVNGVRGPPRRQGSTRTPILTVRTTGIDVPMVSAPPPQPSPMAITPAPAATKEQPMQPTPANSSADLANSSVPSISRVAALIPRHPALALDPVIRSAPLTLGGRMVLPSRPLRAAGAINLPSATGLVGARLPGGPASAIVASPTVASRHHSMLFPQQAPVVARSALHQVPISTTLRTPHVANFTIPPRTASLVPPPGSTLTHGSTTPPSAEKQAFLNMFSQFYDSLNDAKNLKTWLEGQAAKSDALMANLERATRDLEVERARLRQEGGGEEAMRLRSRVGELEERLARLERFGVTNRESQRDSSRMEIDGPSDLNGGTFSASSSPVTQRRPHDYPHYSHPPSAPPAHYEQATGRPRSGSTATHHHPPPPPIPHHRATGPMPLPPIATLSNGHEEHVVGGRSRKGSLVGGLPPPPPPSAPRSRRESFSSNHPPLPPPSMVPSPMSAYPHSKPNSISPPQRPVLPPLGQPRSRSPHYEQHHLRNGLTPKRMSPLPPPPSTVGGRLSPLPPQHHHHRSPYHRMQQVVARPTPTPSPPPPRLVDVGGRVPAV